MEQFKDEIEYCNRMGYHPNDAEEKMQLAKMFAEYKAYLIDQAKKGKLTLQECKDKVAKIYGYKSWLEYRVMAGLRVEGLLDTAAEMYANQFIPVAPAEQWISVKDRLPDLNTTVIVSDGFKVKEAWFGKRTSADIPWFRFVIMEPTHWMPLPTAPESTTSTKQP